MVYAVQRTERYLQKKYIPIDNIALKFTQSSAEAIGYQVILRPRFQSLLLEKATDV